ncbi:MAG: phytoene desaturase [Myxococcales bacterium]|nr:phytoene desaturase [Polyangiaceae bacterium]MDW8249845.1 phytoene desaturase [Myxococcales bacterium]
MAQVYTPPLSQSSSSSIAGHQDGRPHAVVIGSGFGGLAAAIRLGARGYRVTVLERRDQPGGRAYVFRDHGFVFDAGPTVVTAPFLFEELWTLAGKKMSDYIDMRPVSPFYRIRFDDGYVFDYTGDPEAMRRQIRSLSPGDVEGYERFLQESRRIFDVGFTKLAHMPFGKWTDMAKIVPDMIVLKSWLTVYQLVSLYITNEKLRQVLSFHPLLVGGNPYSTTSIYTLIAYLERKWGVHFPMGGTGALVRGLVELIEGQKNQVRCGAEVEEILVENGRAVGVRVRGGEQIRADVVISNADAAFTYRYLVPEQYRRRWTNERVEKARFSMSLFVWYFGTRKKYDSIAHHTILLGPRYRGLLDDIFENKVLSQDFSLYLHRPTATDPSLAPDGCDGFYVLSPVPHLQSGTDWRATGEPYRRSIEAYLERTIMPGLRDSLVTSRIFTPLDFKEELLSLFGAAFSFEPVLSQSAYFRPHNASEDVERLYLVGAGTHPGAGMPGVLSSARVLDTVVPDARTLRP